MELKQSGFQAFTAIEGSSGVDTSPKLFELYVAPGFNDYELTAITQTLSVANDIIGQQTFDWRFVSQTAGLVTSANGVLVRTEPMFETQNLCDLLVVVGGKAAADPGWLRRARAMQRAKRPVVLLSDAATGHIRRTKTPMGRVTTHWRDAATLAETGSYPKLTTRLSEKSDGIITAAGAGATSELIIGLLAQFLEAPQVAELGNQLLLHTIRKSDAEQPKDIADNEGLFDAHVTQAIRLMEASLDDPISMGELTQHIGVSTRHLERAFRKIFDDTPAKFYKRLRTKRARVMIEETLLPLVEVAVVTGFGSSYAMARAVKETYGLTPTKMRLRENIKLLSFEEA
ncbi:AraC family transcriptional regulator [Sulfitobacter sp. SK012]|uniref:GlxA family transcriptional regulator n=1 Tax=Sulfitobacter sp. SK012 TaxID=1389005 RepID=UPI000E0A586B|nr:helix-turn-helix domain-containing protein [Sulfitobacter sp. SK012]AXI47151.1 AraC family transcriptional regulator [Sulfitobacter sp. SK012]